MRVVPNTIVREFVREYKISLILQKDINKSSPKLPFLTYNITSLHLPFSGEGNYSRTIVDSLDDRFDFDILETREIQPTMMFSFNSYSKDHVEAQETALLLRDWLIHGGTQIFRDNNFVIVDAGTIQDRTIELEGSFEYRYGFDVEVRYTRIIERRIETIENFDIYYNDEKKNIFNDLD